MFTFATARTIIKPLTFRSFLGRLWNGPVRASQWNLRICTPSRRWNSVKLFVRLTVLFCRDSRSCFTVILRNSAANVIGSSIPCNLQLLWRLCHFSPNYQTPFAVLHIVVVAPASDPRADWKKQSLEPAIIRRWTCNVMMQLARGMQGMCTCMAKGCPPSLKPPSRETGKSSSYR